MEPKESARLREAIEEIRGYITRDVAGGFADPGQITESVLELMGDELDDEALEELRPHAERVTREAVEAHRAAERSWPKVTDCDRLDAAFAALEEAGVVCRQNFSCCGNCGVAEIVDEIAAERDAGREVIGYTFYHVQDTESAVEGGGLYLHYGSVLRSAKAAVAVGRQIVDALRDAGLRVKWDGTVEKRIHVSLDWKRRLPRPE